MFNKADLANSRLQQVGRYGSKPRINFRYCFASHIAEYHRSACRREPTSHVCFNQVEETREKGESRPCVKILARGTALHILLQLVSHLVDTTRAGHRPAGSVMLVLGVPNVGKSTLIGAVRRTCAPSRGGKRRGTKGPTTGRKAGVTRFVSAFAVSSNPELYLIDSPGVLVPRIDSIAHGVKLALTGALPDAAVPPDELAHFLLCPARDRGSRQLRKALGLAHLQEDSWKVLEELAVKWRLCEAGGAPDCDAAAASLVAMFRSGALGQYTLDDVPCVR